MADYDVVIVGSGINSLACGALLARGGMRVCVLERNDWLGGAIKSAEIKRGSSGAVSNKVVISCVSTLDPCE